MHDLNSVNSEVAAYNIKLQTRMSIHSHVHVVDPDLKRKHFARHGLHTNHKGKEEAAKKITEVIESIIKEETTSCITLPLKEVVVPTLKIVPSQHNPGRTRSFQPGH